MAWRGAPAAAALAVYGAVSVGLMHDWLAWNSARWAVGRRALAAGVRPTDIEGGFEWHRIDELGRREFSLNLKTKLFNEGPFAPKAAIGSARDAAGAREMGGGIVDGSGDGERAVEGDGAGDGPGVSTGAMN